MVPKIDDDRFVALQQRGKIGFGTFNWRASSSALWHLPQFGLSVIRSSGTRLRLWQDGQRVLNVDMTSSLYFALRHQFKLNG